MVHENITSCLMDHADIDHRGFLPPPHIISPFDSRPLWDYLGLCALLDQRPSELTEILLRNGPVHLAGDKGIPSSWKALVEG